ncbi:hypothetical protein IDH16_01685 [Pelagibacterales bacterium SAG-MED45]|nr:hypothetical protein [Pelagibacterales bacterium SAG-MED45]
MVNNNTDIIKNKISTVNKSNIQTKTTDINILLNRVKLEKKKNLKKNIIVSLLLVTLVCSIAIYLII